MSLCLHPWELVKCSDSVLGCKDALRRRKHTAWVSTYLWQALLSQILHRVHKSPNNTRNGKGYMRTPPERDPIARILCTGSNAIAVGWYGKPWRTVCGQSRGTGSTHEVICDFLIIQSERLSILYIIVRLLRYTLLVRVSLVVLTPSAVLCTDPQSSDSNIHFSI